MGIRPGSEHVTDTTVESDAGVLDQFCGSGMPVTLPQRTMPDSDEAHSGLAPQHEHAASHTIYWNLTEASRLSGGDMRVYAAGRR